jgi:hypothetical protein
MPDSPLHPTACFLDTQRLHLFEKTKKLHPERVCYTQGMCLVTFRLFTIAFFFLISNSFILFSSTVIVVTF